MADVARLDVKISAVNEFGPAVEGVMVPFLRKLVSNGKYEWVDAEKGERLDQKEPTDAEIGSARVVAVLREPVDGSET